MTGVKAWAAVLVLVSSDIILGTEATARKKFATIRHDSRTVVPAPNPAPTQHPSIEPVSYLASLKMAHAIMATVSWGFLLPVYFAIVSLYRFQDSNIPSSFSILSAIFVVLPTICSWILGVVAFGLELKEQQHNYDIAHLVLGIVIAILGVIVISAAKTKFVWLKFVAQGLLSFCCIVQVFIGFDIMNSPRGLRIAYIVFLVLFGGGLSV